MDQNDPIREEFIQLIRPFEEKYGSFSELDVVMSLALKAFKNAKSQNNFKEIDEMFNSLLDIENGLKRITTKHQLVYDPARPKSATDTERFLRSLTSIEKEVNYLGAVVKYISFHVHYFLYVAFALTDDGRRPWPPYPM